MRKYLEKMRREKIVRKFQDKNNAKIYAKNSEFFKTNVKF